MTGKGKHPAGEGLRAVAQVLSAPKNPDPARWERAFAESWSVAAHTESILVLLLRGLNNEEEMVRLQAAKGFLRAFPNAEGQLERLLYHIVESVEPKVRLAEIKRLLTIFPAFLAGLSGMKPDESTTTGREPNAIREDRMELAGRWVAWTRDRQRILAVADSFTDAMTRAFEAGEADPYVKKAPGVAQKAARKPLAIREDESPNIVDDVRKMFPEPEAWLDAPNESLGGEKPRDLLGTEREADVRYLLRGIIDGITT